MKAVVRHGIGDICGTDLHYSRHIRRHEAGPHRRRVRLQADRPVRHRECAEGRDPDAADRRGGRGLCSGLIDTTLVLTQQEPITSAIDAHNYKSFGERKPGRIKVELEPQAVAAWATSFRSPISGHIVGGRSPSRSPCSK